MLLHSSLPTEHRYEVASEGQDEAQSVSDLEGAMEEVEVGASMDPDVETIPFVGGKPSKDISWFSLAKEK